MNLHTPFRLGRGILSLLAITFLLAGPCCFAQRDYIGKYDLYVGFSDINAPFVNNVNQPGVGVQGGMAHNRWLASGFDYGCQSSTGPITAGLLTKPVATAPEEGPTCESQSTCPRESNLTPYGPTP